MMRYETKVKLLAGGTLFLLLLWGAGQLFAPERRLARSEAGRLLSGEAGAAASLELKAGGERIVLEKRGEAWALLEGDRSLPAQGGRVAAFLEALGAVRQRRPVASSAQAWRGLGLESGSSRDLLVKDGKGGVLAELSAGDKTPRGNELYIRLPGSEASYAVDSSFDSYLSAGRGSWLDKRLLPPLEPREAQSLSITADIDLEGGAKPRRLLSYRLARTPEGWSAEGKTLDALAVEALLRAVINLEAEELSALPPEGGFARIGASIEIGLGSGQTKRIELGLPAGEGRFWARSAEAASPAYQVSVYALRNLFKPLSELETKG